MYQILPLTILLLLLNPIHLQSQHTRSTGPELNITFPTNGDTTKYSQIRVSGNTSPDAIVRLNNRYVKVYPSGAFVGRVNLHPKWNEILFSSRNSTGSAVRKLYVYRIPRLRSNPSQPTQIDTKMIVPDQNLVLFSGDLLQVRFKGSPGGEAKFSLDKICKNIPMTELSPDEANGIMGVYSGVVTVVTDKNRSPKPIEFELEGIDGRNIKIKSTALIEVRTTDIPFIGELTKETDLRNAVKQWSVLSTLPAGTRTHIIGKIGDLYKIRLSQTAIGYITAESVKLLPVGTPIPHASISLPAIRYKEDWIQLSMEITTAVPFVINQSINPPALELTVYGAHLSSQWITYPNHESEIKLISWSQPSADIFKLRVALNQPQQWGHRVKFKSRRMIMEIRRTPRFARPPHSPLKGLVIAVDAGHGGEEKGAVGATGLMEKDVNLIYAKKLAALLKNVAAKVVLTRTDDSTMSLEQRVKIARQANAHIFCWLHNNSIGSTSNPEAVRGTSTYFTIPQNQDLAWTVYPRLIEIGLQPFGKIHSAYYVTRQTDMLVVLVEGGFLSHPEDEMLLMDDKFLDRLANAVFWGLEDFCRKQRDLSFNNN